jgi:hypothetical protein
LLADHDDPQRVQDSDVATTQAVYSQSVSVPRKVSDRIKALRAHGFRRTDHIRAAHAVMMHAIAASIAGVKTNMAISESGGPMFHICSE